MDGKNKLMESTSSISNDERNKALVAILSIEEIKKIVFSFKGEKYRRPNGFPMCFFQDFWDVVQNDVYFIVKEFFGSK